MQAAMCGSVSGRRRSRFSCAHSKHLTDGAVSHLLGVCERLTLALRDRRCPLGSFKGELLDQVKKAQVTRVTWEEQCLELVEVGLPSSFAVECEPGDFSVFEPWCDMYKYRSSG